MTPQTDIATNAANVANLVEGFNSSFDETPHPALGQGSPEMGGEFSGEVDDEMAFAHGLAAGDDLAEISKEAVDLCAVEPPNDTGNGKRLLFHFGDDLKLVNAVGWHAWTGNRWRRESGKEIARRSAQLTAARIVLEADAMSATPMERRLIELGERARADYDAHMKNKPAEAGDEWDARRKELLSVMADGDGARSALSGRKIARRKYSIASGNSGKIKGMLEEATPHCTIQTADLDADHLAFNVENGTLFFERRVVDDPDGSVATGYTKAKWFCVLRPHERRDMITKMAPVTYDENAKCPNFDASMLRFQPDTPTREFLQRYHGYAMTGQTGEQCLVFNFGEGANWKSTFMEIVARVMGDYAASINFESISGDQQKSGSQASPDIARLLGARLVRSSEPDRSSPFKESLIKSLTGGEPILTRHNYGDFFEFSPTFKLVLAGNHKPEIGGVDHGIWRRIRFVLWPTKIPDDARRPFDDVIAELYAERAGILNWMIRGALEFLEAGLRTPQAVLDSTASYREEMDPVGSFIEDCVTVTPPPEEGEASAVKARDMYVSYTAWCWANGVRAWKEKSFATTMSQKGFVKERSKTSRNYINVVLHDVPIRPRSYQGGHEPPHPADNEDAIPS